MSEAEYATKSDLAYTRVRGLILSGELTPGQVLPQASLARTIGMSTTPLREALRRHDRNGRFRLYHPYTAGGTPIYVHAKVLIVDDRLLRIGSSNLNNRSMGLDTECDIAAEPVDAAGRQRARNRLRPAC